MQLTLAGNKLSQKKRSQSGKYFEKKAFILLQAAVVIFLPLWQKLLITFQNKTIVQGLLQNYNPFNPIRTGGAHISPPPVIIVCCTLRDADMNSKLFDNFSQDLIEALVKYFFEFLPTLFRKLTSNDINPKIFSIEKTKK